MKPLRGIEIETTTVCNWRCNFCPVAHDLKPAASMSMELFNKLLDKAVEHGTFYTVSVNSYNEPTIDPMFFDRLESIKARGFNLLLHTNGSGLTDEKLFRIANMDILSEMVFNLPTLNKDEFEAVTKYRKLDHIIAMIDKAYALGLKVSIRVNGTTEEIVRNYKPILDRWPTSMQALMSSTDRLNLLPDKYKYSINITDPRLTGCAIPDEWLYVSVTGKVFLCCEDYWQKSIYGDLTTHSIAEVRESEAYQTYYRQINGLEDAPKDLICRSCVLMKAQSCGKAPNA